MRKEDDIMYEERLSILTKVAEEEKRKQEERKKQESEKLQKLKEDVIQISDHIQGIYDLISSCRSFEIFSYPKCPYLKCNSRHNSDMKTIIYNDPVTNVELEYSIPDWITFVSKNGEYIKEGIIDSPLIDTVSHFLTHFSKYESEFLEWFDDYTGYNGEAS